MFNTTATVIAGLICFSLTFVVLTWFCLIFWATDKLSRMNTELRYMAIGNWGEVPLDQFTLKCGVHAAVANWFLSRKARQLNGVRHVNEWGDTIAIEECRESPDRLGSDSTQGGLARVSRVLKT